MEQFRVVLVSRDETSEVLEPTDRPLHFPAPAVSSQLATILGRRFDPVATVRTNQVNAPAFQPRSERVAIRGLVIDQPTRATAQQPILQQRFNQLNFVRAGAAGIRAERQSIGVGEHHNLGALAAFGLADLFTPFFAEQNVPSANASSWFTCPQWSSSRSSRAQACFQMPAAVQSRCRRQQVAGEGKRFGRSFHRAPLRRIHRMPSTHVRAGTGGRPPRWCLGGLGKRSEISVHCWSVSSDSGSIVDPVGDSTARQYRCAMRNLLEDYFYYGTHSTLVSFEK